MPYNAVVSFADYCRWANMGYRDGRPGTEADIAERVRLLEAHCQSYAKSVGNLHRLLDAYEARQS
jgi:hypothetical protein